MVRGLTFVAVPLLAACWTPQHAERVWQGHVLAQSRSDPATVEEPGARLANPVEPRDDTKPRAGDSVVYAIDFESPGKAYRRYLRCSVLDGDPKIGGATITQTAPDGYQRVDRFASRVLPVRIELFDEDAELLAESVAKEALVDLIAMGFTQSCEAYRDWQEWDSVEDVFEGTMHDGPPLFSMSYMLQNDGTLYDLALDLVDTSLVLSAIWNFGIHFSIQPLFEDAEQIEADAVTGAPGYRFPVQFLVNDHPALRIAATVVEPTAPLGLTAGITRVEGFRPTDDRYRFRVRLITPN